MEWQPIETAPKDGTVILVYSPGINLFSIDGQWEIDDHPGVHMARWASPGYVCRDGWIAPYTATDVIHYGEMTGTSVETENASLDPTHWMPLPAPPGEPHDMG